MATLEALAPATSRGKEFGKGVLVALALAVATRVVEIPLFILAQRVDPMNGFGVVSVAVTALAVIVAVGLVRRWWKAHRWRAYGILGVLALPPVLGLAFLGFVVAFNVPLGPR